MIYALPTNRLNMLDEAEVEAALALDPEADTDIPEAGAESSPKKKRNTRATKKGKCYSIYHLNVGGPDVWWCDSSSQA